MTGDEAPQQKQLHRWESTFWFNNGASGGTWTDRFPETAACILERAINADDDSGRQAAELAACLIRYAPAVCESVGSWTYVSPEGFGEVTVTYDENAPLKVPHLSEEEKAKIRAALDAEDDDEDDEDAEDDREWAREDPPAAE